MDTPAQQSTFVRRGQNTLSRSASLLISRTEYIWHSVILRHTEREFSELVFAVTGAFAKL